MSVAMRIADITAAVAEAHRAAADGAAVNLEGLVAVVEAAMGEAAASPPAQRAALKTALIELVKELDALATALAHQHHADAQRRAVEAYGGTGRGE